jgi:hypothetical protein
VEKDTQELEDAFEALYLDNDQETTAGIKRKEEERTEVTRSKMIRNNEEVTISVNS